MSVSPLEIRANNAILDSEIVHVGQDGRADFMSLMRGRGPTHFYALDVLKLDSRYLRDVPLIERKRILRQIIPPQRAHVVSRPY